MRSVGRRKGWVVTNLRDENRTGLWIVPLHSVCKETANVHLRTPLRLTVHGGEKDRAQLSCCYPFSSQHLGRDMLAKNRQPEATSAFA